MRVIRGRFGTLTIINWYQPLMGVGTRREVTRLPATTVGRTMLRAWRRAHAVHLRAIDDGRVLVV